MVRALRAGVPALLLAGMIAVSGWTLGEIYSGPLLFRLVAGAGLASVLLALVVRPLPAWTTAPVSVLGLAGYLAFAVDFSAQQAGVPGALLDNAADALANGVPRLITAMVPIEPQPDSVVIPVVAAWIAGLAAAELAGRGRALPALAPPTVLYGASLFLVGPHRAGIWSAVAFAGLGLAAMATAERRTTFSAPVRGKLDQTTRRALQLRAAVAALAGVAAVVAVAALMGPGLSAAVTRRPADPRAYVSPPRLDALDQNPLIRLSGWAVNPDEHLLDATLTTDSPLRLAVLTDYDGITWHVSGEYRPAARTLPTPAAPPSAATEEAAITPGSQVTVGQRITVVGLGGKLLPAAATARRVDGVRVSLEPSSGTLMLPDGLHSGLSYEVTSQTNVPDDNTLPMADVPSGPAMAQLLSLGRSTPPERMQQLVKQLSDDNSAAYARALALEQFLAVHYRLDANAPSGHALPNLDFFLFGAPNGAGGGGKGTSEQFAAAFAVLARMMGLPSRVVIGFQGRKGTQEIRAKDASAWPEVLFAGVGWVPFNPLPQANQEPEPLENKFQPKPPPSSEPPDQDLLPTQSAAFSPSAKASGSSSAHAASALPVLGAGAGGLIVLLLLTFLISVIIGRRGLRRRRLSEGVPAQRIAGAWLEVTDALRLAGHGGGGHLNATEVAAYAKEIADRPRDGGHTAKGRVRLAAPALDELAQLVNAAEFGGGRVTDADAVRAGVGATAYADELRSRRPWWKRLLWTVHPGPLRWHRK